MYEKKRTRNCTRKTVPEIVREKLTLNTEDVLKKSHPKMFEKNTPDKGVEPPSSRV